MRKVSISAPDDNIEFTLFDVNDFQQDEIDSSKYWLNSVTEQPVPQTYFPDKFSISPTGLPDTLCSRNFRRFDNKTLVETTISASNDYTESDADLSVIPAIHIANSSSAESETAFRIITSGVEQEAVEDGVTHPSEKQVSEFISAFGYDVYVEGLSSNKSSHITADLVRLLGRSSDKPSQRISQKLGNYCLESTDVIIRDAYVQVVELWEDINGAMLLKKHNEPEEWLKDYIDSVLSQFGE